MASKKLTAYERKRLQNIKRNEELLASLKIHAKASELSAAAKRQKVETKSYKGSPQKKLKPQAPVVVRQSLRTRGIPPDCKGLYLVDSDNRTSKSSSLDKSFSPDMGCPLSFKDAFADRNKSDSDRPLIGAVLSVAKQHHGGLVEEKCDGVSVKQECDENLSEKCDSNSFNLIKGVVKTEKTEIGDCVDLESLTLKSKNIARLMPGKILITKFFPSTDLRMVVAGNEYGNVGFWNLDSEQEDEDRTYLYHTHTGPISGIIIQQSCLSKIFTSCYDGFIRLMDVEKEVFDLVHSSQESIFSLAQQPNNVNSLYFSEGQWSLNIWDVRTRKSSTKWFIHETRINTIDFNPQNPNIMATSSVDCTACLWDLRNMDTYKSKPLKIASHCKAVHAAHFSPSGSSLATTSNDDTVGIWSGANFEDTSMIKHNNQTRREISSFRAVWGWDDSYIFIGNTQRGVDVISPALRKTIMTLQSPHLSAIPCRFHAHPYEVGTLAGATSGGQVYVWTSDALSGEFGYVLRGCDGY